jgi:hypothetical protein
MKKMMGVKTIKTVLIKTIGTGVLFGLLSWAVTMFNTYMNGIGAGWMQYVMLLVAGIALSFAIVFRQGFEDIFEAMISMLFMFGIFGLLGNIFKFNMFGTYSVMGLYELGMFFALFFTAEGIFQRIAKKMKFY